MTRTSYQPVDHVFIAQRFLEMLPSIRSVAAYAFRHLGRTTREELVAEVVANVFCAFHRLVERGHAELAFPTALAWFAVKQVREGRRVGSKRNARDALSLYSQRRHGFSTEQLPGGRDPGNWQEIIVEDKRSTPADVAACRLDLRAWFRQLSRQRRAVALRLATGESTSEAACRFGVSKARISQLRRELEQSWEEFQGEKVDAELAVARV